MKSTNRKQAIAMLEVLRDYIEGTGRDKYCALDNPEPHDIMIGAGMAGGYFWGEMYKRMHEIANKEKYNEQIYIDLLKILHEGLCYLAMRHPELLKKEEPSFIFAPPKYENDIVSRYYRPGEGPTKERTHAKGIVLGPAAKCPGCD